MPKLPLSDALSEYIERSGYTIGQVARLSQVPRRSIANWVTGKAKRPRHAADLLKVANVLRLNSNEVERLLDSAEFSSSLRNLLSITKLNDPLYPLLTIWQETAPVLIDEATTTRPIPFQAIRDLPYFVGRVHEIATLSKQLLEHQNALCVIQGMGGVGKSSLAARLAYQLRDNFPDGVLWAKVTSSNTMAIMHSFASAFGRDVSNYTDEQTRSQVVREILAHKRVLLVLDDISQDNDIQLLLPPTTEQCGVIVTTRRLDLASLLGAFWYRLSSFDTSQDEALSLYAKIVGEGRVLTELSTFQEMADLLGHLPLAVAITAGQLATDPITSASALLDRLKQEKKYSSQLVYGSDSLTASFDISYASLSAEEQNLFDCLGIFPTEDIFVEAVAAVAQVSPKRANEILQNMYRLSLVQIGTVDHFKLHPLLHDYAKQSHQADAGKIERMVRFAVEFIEANRRDIPKITLVLSHILTAIDYAQKLADHSLYFRGIFAIFPFLNATGQIDLAEAHLNETKRLAVLSSNVIAQAHSLWALAENVLRRDPLADVAIRLQEALNLLRDAAFTQLHGDIHESLGYSLLLSGSFQDAAKTLNKGLRGCMEIDYPTGACRILARLAACERDQAHYAAAKAYELEGLEIAERLQDQELMCRLLRSRGATEYDQNNFAVSVSFYRESHSLAVALGDVGLICYGMVNLASNLFRMGQNEEPLQLIDQSITLAHETGNQRIYVFCLINRARINLRLGNLFDTKQDCDKALVIVSENNYSRQFATVQGILAELENNLGNFEEAERLCSAALETARLSGFRERELGILTVLVELLIRKGDLARADEVCVEGFQFSKELRMKVIEAEFLIDFGRIRLAKGLTTSALDYLQQAEHILTSQNSPLLYALLIWIRGDIQLLQGNLDTAKSDFEVALATFDVYPYYEYPALAIFSLARCYAMMGNLEKGVEFGRKSHNMLYSSGYAMAEEVGEWLASQGVMLNNKLSTDAKSY